MSGKVITFVTGNAKKLEEFRAILGSQFPHSLVSKDVDLPEYQGSPEDVVREKCREAARLVRDWEGLLMSELILTGCSLSGEFPVQL